MVADAIGLGERFTNPFDVIVTHGCLVCMKSDRVTKALNEFARFANNIVLVEADYSKFSHENVKNGYPVNDYEAILKECGWHMVGRNDTFMNVSGISNVSIIWAVKNSLQNGDVQCSTEING